MRGNTSWVDGVPRAKATWPMARSGGVHTDLTLEDEYGWPNVSFAFQLNAEGLLEDAGVIFVQSPSSISVRPLCGLDHIPNVHAPRPVRTLLHVSP